MGLVITVAMVAGLHRYMCDRGYRNAPHKQALRNARTVAMMVFAIIVVMIIITGAGK